MFNGSQQTPKTKTIEISIRLVRALRARSCSSFAADLKKKIDKSRLNVNSVSYFCGPQCDSH